MKLFHIGTKRHSGRYPWGSGEDPQRSFDLLSRIDELKNKGYNDNDIVVELGVTSTIIRQLRSRRKEAITEDNRLKAVKWAEKGVSKLEIARRLNVTDGTVRNLLKPTNTIKRQATKNIVDMLKKEVDEKGFIDVGKGSEQYIGISRERLKTALSVLKEEGYNVHSLYVDQISGKSGQKTTMQTLTKPEITIQDTYKNLDKIKIIGRHTSDGGLTIDPIPPITSISSKRVKIVYNEEGGAMKDGVIEIRRGLDDMSLGKANYAQVRIAVDGTHYMKGMCVYSDNVPKSYDVLYNTNKSIGTDPKKVFKQMEPDPDNPFGATIKPGGVRKALNIVNEEGDWAEWSKNISAQMLSKQSVSLANQQLKLSIKQKQEEFDELMSLTNPTVKKYLLKTFADEADATAVDLKAAALPRQGSHSILPLKTIKETEVYAPNYEDGEKVVLIRYPHGGIFEIPELKVNNKNKEAINMMGRAKDAIGIHPKVAEQLSGADFDGDTVIVIPNNNKAIKTKPILDGLKNYDPKIRYHVPEELRVKEGELSKGKIPKIKEKTKQRLMGEVSNLITDMTIKKAPLSDIAKAVRHSMTVIDSEKHYLNYKASAIDNSISLLKQKYQMKPDGKFGGASTLISRASSEIRVDARREITPNKQTGERTYVTSKKGYTNSKGEFVPKQITSTKMFETKNAFTLSSGSAIENVYASYANTMKRMANEARKNMVNTPSMQYSPNAKKVYVNEVATLDAKLNAALKNKPLERNAQRLAKLSYDIKKEMYPDMTAKQIKKAKGKAIIDARIDAGAKKKDIIITPKEWEAIQNGAISSSKLMSILENTKDESIKKLATPKTERTILDSKRSKIEAYSKSGRTQAEIARALGISVSTVSEVLKGG